MALTPSTMLPLGTKAPQFSLPDTEGELVSLADFDQQELLLVMFICNHCPYVVHVRDEIANLTREYMGKGVGVVAIMSNDVSRYPADAPEKMRAEKRQAGYPFPYLYDETQAVAKAFRAACTPEFYLFDRDRHLAYRGEFDQSRPGNGIPVTGASLRQALDCLLAGEAVDSAQKPSMGCNIKWKAGQEPNYK